jgi:hypothetical protein
MDWSIITPRISCGGSPDPAGVQGLLRYGHTHVIDLRHTENDSDLYWLNFAYLRNPTFDDGATKDTEWFHRSIKFALGALVYPEHRLYVGCHSGVNRAPSTVAAILMSLGWPRDLAIETISRARQGCELAYITDAMRAVTELGIK